MSPLMSIVTAYQLIYNKKAGTTAAIAGMAKATPLF